MLKKVKVSLRPIVSKLNLPTVLKTAVLPGDSVERLFIATQTGEIFYIGNGEVVTFLDIRQRIIKLGVSGGGYDERGLLGLAFHPQFYYNGLFYIHYSVAGTQGPGALSVSSADGQGQNGLPEFFEPDPCDQATLNLKWADREALYDHIDTVEEWMLQSNGRSQRRRTLLNLRRPFFNHNGVNSLNFSPETGKLVLTTGDGGSGYDPFNLSQDYMEIAGKIIEINTANSGFVHNPPVVTRFNELPASVQGALTVIAKGVRNITGISYLRFYNRFIKYVGIVGQDLVEAIYSFIDYRPIPVTMLVQAALSNIGPDPEGFINFGWRGWEGAFPASVIKDCSKNPAFSEKTIAYYNDAIKTAVQRLPPLTSYYHHDPRRDKFGGTALTGVQPYMGNGIPDLKGNIVFTDFARNEGSQPPVRGALGYTRAIADCRLNDFSVIETDYDFGNQSAYYTSLGTDQNQIRLYLGVYGSMNVTDFNRGTVYEIVS